jgi:trimethylamine--corrinoid protein Co-methyltransferase
MYQIRADQLGLPVEDVFCASSYIISPLRMANDFCEHLLYFHDRGLKVRIGNMFSAGGTGPVTLAGCLALGLAERLAISILERCLYGFRSWVLYGEIAPLDMRSMLLPLGRPEILLINLAVIQMARHYQTAAQTLGGVSDAALPSAEAGMQKVMTALPCILAGGCNIDPGRLGIDTLYSPIQMILDAELISALRRVISGFEINDEMLGLDVINEVDAGGLFFSSRHTVRHMRKELWQPTIWSKGIGYSDADIHLVSDVERATNRWHEFVALEQPDPQIDEQTEKEYQKIIDRVAAQLPPI